MKHVYKLSPTTTMTIETDELPEIPTSGKISMDKFQLFEIVRLLEKNNRKVSAVRIIRDYCNCSLCDALSICNDIVENGY